MSFSRLFIWRLWVHSKHTLNKKTVSCEFIYTIKARILANEWMIFVFNKRSLTLVFYTNVAASLLIQHNYIFKYIFSVESFLHETVTDNIIS